MNCLRAPFGLRIALEGGIMNLSSMSGIRKKAVWGRGLLIAIFIGVFALQPGAAFAGPGKGKAPKKPQHAKLDRSLNDVADNAGESDVIVEFFDDSDAVDRIQNRGGRAGRKLGILNARSARIPNLL